MPRSLTCPKCGSSMAAGFVPDQVYGYFDVGKWVAGSPEKSIWTGLKMRGRDQIKIVTYRCSRCGYLESYAPAT